MKPKFNPDNTCDIRLVNMPGKGQFSKWGYIPNANFPFAVVKAVFGFASGVRPIVLEHNLGSHD